LILRKITKIVATRYQILRLKCTKFNFGWRWGFAPNPAGGAYSAPPDLLAGLKGPTSKGREGMGRGRGQGRSGERKGGQPPILFPSRRAYEYRTNEDKVTLSAAKRVLCL